MTGRPTFAGETEKHPSLISNNFGRRTLSNSMNSYCPFTCGELSERIHGTESKGLKERTYDKDDTQGIECGKGEGGRRNESLCNRIHWDAIPKRV